MIISAYLVLACIFGVANPLFEAPDEHHHFYTVHYITTNGHLPIANSGTLARQEAAQPPLYYLLGALLVAPFNLEEVSLELWPNPFLQFSQTTTIQNINAFIHSPVEDWPWSKGVGIVHGLRLFSTLLGAGTLFFVYSSGRLLWPRNPDRSLLALALIAFWPQFLFIHSSITNDSLITLLSTAVLWQLVWFWSKGITKPQLAVIGVMIGLAILSKMTGLLLLPFSLVVVAGLLWRDGNFRDVLSDAAIVIGISLAISGWLLWRNWALYGDITATNQFIALAGGVRPYSLQQVWQDMDRVWQSLFAFFGWMTVRPPNWVYGLWTSLSLLAGVGIAISLVMRVKNNDGWRSEKNKQWWLKNLLNPTVWLSGWWLVVIFAWLHFMRQTPADQGRLWFPAILPMVLGLAYGLTQFQWRRISLCAGLLALATAITSLLTIQQAYARPLILDELSAIPSSVTRLEEITWDDGIGLLAAEIEQETAVPGEWVWATFFWQAKHVPQGIPVIELHALGRGYDLVGQIKTYHGRGQYPANLWSDGEIVVDRVGIQLNEAMQTPTQVRIMLLWEQGSGPVQLGQLNVHSPNIRIMKKEWLAQIDNKIGLVQADVPVMSVTPGETISVTLGWQVEVAPHQPLTAFIHIGNPEEPPVAQKDAPPLAYDYPPQLWAAGDTITDTFSLEIPEDLPNGRYPIYTGMYDPKTAVRLSLLKDNIQQPNNAYLINWITVQSDP